MTTSNDKPVAPKRNGRAPAGKKTTRRAAESTQKASTNGKARAKDVCFVISPFGGWHDEYHREIFCAAIKSAGLEPVRADDLFRSSNIVHDIWHLVTTSRVLLADLTGKNPNVFYELGLAHAARKPVLLLTQSMDDVPFDLRALRVITYDVEHPAWGRLLGDSIKSGLQETMESPERSVLPTFLVETPDQQPTVTQDERRFLDLQQQLDSLRAEMRGGIDRGYKAIRDPEEARALIRRSLVSGMAHSEIISFLTDRGVPSSWTKNAIAEARHGD
jgi:hypothetical protein